MVEIGMMENHIVGTYMMEICIPPLSVLSKGLFLLHLSDLSVTTHDKGE